MGNTNIKLTSYYPPPTLYTSGNQKAFRNQFGCTEDTPCGRVPCKNCGAAMQCWFVMECDRIFYDQSNLQSVSIVMAQHATVDRTAKDNQLKLVTRAVRDVIARANLNDRPWMGGVDVSLNTAEWSPGSYYWQYQAMMITSDLSTADRRKLRSCLKTTFDVSRPLLVKSVYDLDGMAEYALKPDFNARYSYFNKNDRRNTHTSALKGAGLKQLSESMSDTLHQDRLITIGLRRHGNVLVKT